jgi:hydroxyacylglutathione hydrolase
MTGRTGGLFNPMEILRWQVGNTLKNYQYILCDGQKNAVLIDPLDTEEIVQLVASQKLSVKAILISHEHNDHAAEALPMQERFRVPVYTSPANVPLIKAKATAVADAAMVPFAGELKIKLHVTPGHTAGHAAFEVNGFLFSGDCLFHGGCGHCRLPGANVEEHFRTFSERLAKLPPDLIVMPGHYYAVRNLDFSLHVEPQNARARALREKLTTERGELNHETTLKQEKDYNPFMRLNSRALRARVAELTGRNLAEASDLAVFTELRALRDKW